MKKYILTSCPEKMNIGKKLVLVIGFLAGTMSLFAQYDALISQYMFNPSGYNPAAAGASGRMDVTGQHRLNWIDMPHGGTTTIFNINSLMKIGGATQGLGLNFFNDKVGLFVNQSVALQYAMKFKLGKGLLSAGIQGGILSIGFQGDSARGPLVSLGEYHDIGSDEVIPKSLTEGFGLDLSAGLWYQYKEMYLGASFSHFNQPEISWTDELSFKPTGTLYLTGGTERTLTNPKYIFHPSFLFRTDFYNWQAEISGILFYNKQYWGGLSYRIGDAVVFIGGMNIEGGISIGYSFDLATNQLVTQNWGSHEVLISYQFEIDNGSASRRKKYKNIRIL